MFSRKKLNNPAVGTIHSPRSTSCTPSVPWMEFIRLMLVTTQILNIIYAQQNDNLLFETNLIPNSTSTTRFKLVTPIKSGIYDSTNGVWLRHDVEKSPRRLWQRPPFTKGANSWEKF